MRLTIQLLVAYDIIYVLSSIPAILLQIKLAISSTDPRPARLHPVNWDK